MYLVIVFYKEKVLSYNLKYCRCLFYCIAVWHQYDDAIFSSPMWFQNVRNKLPSFLKSMDSLEGRNIATWAMLPHWEGFLVDDVSTKMTAREAIMVINDLAYCMTQTQAEQHGYLSRNIPNSYDFSRVSNWHLS